MRHVDGLCGHRNLPARPLHMYLVRARARLGPVRARLYWTVLLHLPTLRGSPLGEAATGFSNESELHVNGGIGRMAEQTASDKPLHHGAKTCPNLEDVQGLLCSGARQCRAQALPDIAIQRAVVDALLGSEIAREAIGA